MDRNALFVLGAGDPEMQAIEALLHHLDIPLLRATVNGKRVYAANAYAAELPQPALELLGAGGRVYLVECIGHAPTGVVRIDHHFPGDPGYGLAPDQFWRASSLGQTVRILAEELGIAVAVTQDMRFVAAADHCLGAAYRGLCPGVDADALLAWHIASRVGFEKRSEAAVRRDVAATRETLRNAPRVVLAPGVWAADVRGRQVPELLISAAREALCCLSEVVTRAARRKVGCLVGSPQQIHAFMELWAPAQGLVDIYGDPMRGFAGAYLSAAVPVADEARGIGR